MSDLGNANWSEADASNNATPPNGWPEAMNPSDVNNSARANMGALKRWWNRANAVKTTGGSTTAFTLAYDVAASTYYDGEVHVFVADRDCVDDATLNINSVGAKNVRKFTGTAFANVEDGDWLANQIVAVRRNASDDKFDVIFVSYSWTDFVRLAGSNTFTGAQTFTGAVALGASATATTQSQADNSTKLGTTGYMDRVAVQQVVVTQDGAVATGSTALPMDNTIPQNTEGNEFMTLEITPKSGTSKLVIEVQAVYASSTVNFVTMALFQDGTANALTASVNWAGSTGVPNIATLNWTMTSGTTSATTFKVRLGSPDGAPITFNGSAGSRLMGGVMNSFIRITEIGI